MLKSAATAQTRAATDLAAANRWVVTGAWAAAAAPPRLLVSFPPPAAGQLRRRASALNTRPRAASLAGTPIGGDSADLQGQLQALQLFPFSTPQFFADWCGRGSWVPGAWRMRVLLPVAQQHAPMLGALPCSAPHSQPPTPRPPPHPAPRVRYPFSRASLHSANFFQRQRMMQAAAPALFLLRAVMVRHTKDQVLGGAAVLELPPKTHEDVAGAPAAGAGSHCFGSCERG